MPDPDRAPVVRRAFQDFATGHFTKQEMIARVTELGLRTRRGLTLAQIDHHADAIDEIDVAGILAFAERVLPRASDLWVQAALNQKQRLQRLFFPEGIAFDGNQFNRTAATAMLFRYLPPNQEANEGLVSQEGIEISGS